MEFGEEYYSPDEFLEKYELKLREIMFEAVNAKIKSSLEELKQLKAECEDLQECKRKHSDDMKSKLKEKEIEVFQQIFGFCVNEDVYIVACDKISVKCEKCSGTGHVETEVLGKIVTIKCPFCDYGNNNTYFYYPKKAKVKAIRLWATRNDSWDKKKPGIIKGHNVEIYLDKNDFPTSPDKIFRTEEDCQAVCDQKNAEEAEGK